MRFAESGRCGQPIGTVEIRCGNETLANITPVATAR